MIRRILFAAWCAATAFAAAPRLTTIQDVLYKADGTRFNGILTISWHSFQSPDSATIVTQSTPVKVVDGNLRVQLVPCAATAPTACYTVVYNSDGRVQFQEMWAVAPSSVPVRVRDVRSADAAPASDTGSSGSGPISEADVTGLVADLGARPVKGSSLSAGRVAFINAIGAIDSVSGNPSDCVKVDGSTGPCGGSSSSNSFVDGDSPSGIVDGANTAFALSAVPNPPSSLAVYRNGMLQKAGFDYTASGSALHFVTGATPQPGDTLLASYRLGGDSGTVATTYPVSQILCGGVGASTAATALTSLASCTIAPGVLSAGDRVEIQLDFAHSGSTSGFTMQVKWGGTTLWQRSGVAADTNVTARAQAALGQGSSLSVESWGTQLPFSATVAGSAEAYASGLTIDFRGQLAALGDSLTLLNYTVVRLP